MQIVASIVEGDGEVPALPVLLRRLGEWLTDSQRGFRFDPTDAADPETPRDAKGRIGLRMVGGRYREITDQPAFSARMNLDQARTGSRSFRKLCSEWCRQVGK